MSSSQKRYLFGRRTASVFDPNFKFQIDTRNLSTGSSASNQYKIPLVSQQTEPITIHWGDGNSDIITTWNQSETTHTYAVEGVYNITVDGVVNGFQYNNSGDKLKQLDITNWGEFNCLLTSVFWGCNNLTSLAEDIGWINSLVNGNNMFRDNSLTSLPIGMELPLLTDGVFMFFRNSITNLPSGMSLPLLIDGNSMFRNNSLTSLPDVMELPVLTIGNNMFLNNTINTTRYSQLLIDLENLNPNDNVTFYGGNSKYNLAGEIARDALIARGWIITDGGLE